MMILKLWQWFKRLFLSFFKEKEYKLLSVEDIPEEETLNDKTVYWVGRDDNKWCAAFKCPCGCNEVIKLNLLPKGSPCWNVIQYKKPIFSIKPSINRTKGCKSHFYITENNIVWAQPRLKHIS